MLLDKHLVAGDQQSLERGLVQVLQYPPLLLLQSALRLLHVLGHGVLAEELGRLPHVESLRVLEELVLETLFVHAEVLAPGGGVILVEAELHVAVLDHGDQPLVNCLSLPLPLDESEHGVGDLLVEVSEQVVTPGDEGQLVDLVDPLPALLALSPHPVSTNKSNLNCHIELRKSVQSPSENISIGNNEILIIKSMTMSRRTITSYLLR